MVKILAPISSFEAACRAIAGGVNEIFCGVEVPGVNYIGLGTRPSWCSLPNYDELARIVDYAHNHGVTVAATTEFPFMAELIEDRIRRHIDSLVQAGIDALIATDIGIILLAKNILPSSIPFYASTYIAPTNYEVVDLLKQMGVRRVMLERHLTIDEIREIVRLCKGIETEVFVHGPGCSNINVNCYGCGFPMVLNPKRLERMDQVQTLCQMNFEVFKLDGSEKRKIADAPILDAYSWCSLCYLQDLIQTGVTGLKIAGRECDQEFQGGVAKIYRELTDLLEKGRTKEFRERLQYFRKSPLFSDSCAHKRCYYAPLFHAPYKMPVASTDFRG
jgi:putative protease